MSPQTKRDSSSASIRLTRRNYHGGPPLTQVGGKPTRSANGIRNEADSNGDISAEHNGEPKSSKPEPDIEDEPLSSSDELSDDSLLSSGEKRRREEWSPSFQKTYAQVRKAEDEAKRTPEKKRKIDGTPSRRGERRAGRGSTRTSPEKLFNGQISLREDNILSKKRNRAVYKGGFRNIHSPAKVPGPRNGFKGSKNEFKVPLSEPDSSDPMAHSSQISSDAPAFKNPLSVPDGFYSSSQPTTNSQEQEFSDLEFDPDESLSSLDDEILDGISSDFSCDEAPSRSPAYCPMCKESVDHEMLDDFLASKKINTREQRRFCESHKRKSAEQEWKMRHYPLIDWDKLDERIGRHFDELEQILNMKRPSFYRDSVESFDSVKKGALRFTVGSKELDRISPGYYGPRGSKKMMDALMSRFSDDIGELSASDKLIQATGVSGFAQTVLVPELTVMLVKEDMHVDDKTARRIMEESEEIGDLLNEQPDDHVEFDADAQYEML